MITAVENELLIRVENGAPMGRMMRENYWIPFALSDELAVGGDQKLVRLLGENFVAFRAMDGRIGFFEELCPHRRASLYLARMEEGHLRCIFHGWKFDVTGRLVDCPTEQTNAEAFRRKVKAPTFPVHEAGGLAWVWLGEGAAPAFPDLPFVGTLEKNTWLSVSLGQCNWLQGVEGTLDSAHVGTLHQYWIRRIAQMRQGTIGMSLDGPPVYDAAAAPYGMRAAALRPLKGGRTYVRVTEYFMPFVSLVPAENTVDRTGVIFIVAPVDDRHHLLFFGHYSESTPQDVAVTGVQPAGEKYDIFNYAPLPGGREKRWSQDRALMRAGHFSGYGKNLIEEDMVVQASMGPILDRTKEFLSTSDVAVVHGRRMLLDAVTGWQSGRRPPGNAVDSGHVSVLNPIDAVLEPGMRWQDWSMKHAAA